jgi:hypothetical protein
MAAPLSAEKLEAWEAWAGELTGPRKAEFDDMNARYGVTDHRAYLQPMPDGNYLVLVTTDGPGSESFMANVATSDHEFDHWFMKTVADVHGMDPSGPMPPMAARRI